MPRAKVKKRKTNSTSRKTVSRKSIAVQRKPVVKKDKSKIAWQIALGIVAALLLIFIISKFSTSMTGNVPAVDAADTEDGSSGGAGATREFSFFDNLKEAFGAQESDDETDVSLKEEVENKEFLDAFDTFMVKTNEATDKIINPILPVFSSFFGPTQKEFVFAKVFFVLLTFFGIWYLSGRIEELNGKGGIRIVLSFVLGILFTRWVADDNLLQTVWVPFSAIGNTAGFIWYSLRLFVFLAIVIYITVFGLKGKKYEPLRILIWIGAIIWLILGWINGINVSAMGSSKKYLFVYPVSIVIILLMVLFSPMIRKSIADSKRKFVREETNKIRAKSVLIAGKKVAHQTGEKMNPTLEKEMKQTAITGSSSYYQEDADGVATE